MPVKIVDREHETKQLRSVAANPPALVVLRGRRRVGKSFLLRAALPPERLISYLAEDSTQALQLQAFATECSRLIPGSPQLSFGSWGDALAFVEAQASAGGPLVVVMDEFQRLANQDSSLESVIQNAWDTWDHEEIPVTLVLSGSALSFMAGLFQGGKPTHGRSIFRPLLLPLSYRDVAPFGPRLTAVEQIERFSVIGGTPQYQRWAGKRSLDEILQEVVLSPDAPLYDDPEHLIREEEEIQKPGPYFGIMEAIARGYTDPTAIGGLLQISSQLATKFLGRLEELGYASKVDPIEPDGKGAARGYWKISDPYFRFWFRYVFPNRSRLSRGRIKEVAAEIKNALAKNITSLVFEDCCREWIGSYSDLGATAEAVGSWWSRKSDTEVDVVALDKKGYTVLGACKWLAKPVGTSVLDDLQAARQVIGPKANQAQLVIFSKSGFAPTLEERAEDEGVALVSVEQLFA